jgi:UDPglucose 6-dehydrogenase
VVGVDTDAGAVAALSAGRARSREPQLEDLMARARERLSATTGFAAAAATDVSFVLVPTPSRPDGGFALDHVLDAVRRLGAALRDRGGYHVVVIVSTVMPGSADGEIRAALEDSSGRAVGTELGLCVSPEFVALGSVVRDMLDPPLVVIGSSDARAGDVLEAIQRRIAPGTPEIHRVSLVDAELAKLVVNTFVTTKISYASMVAELCERLPGADARAVCAAAGADPRIGPAYFAPGTAFGGPCFPRDNRALAALGEQVGVDATIAAATHAVNERQLGRLLGAVEARLPAGGTVAVLGLSYKPGTEVVEESAGMALAAALAAHGWPVLAADPAATPDVPRGVTLCSAAEAAAGAGVVVVTTPWPEFRTIAWDAGLPPGASRVVIDPWAMLDPETMGRAELVRLGQGA